MILRTTTLIGIVISMVAGVALGIAMQRYKGVEAPDNASFSEVLRHVHSYYVEEVPEEQLVNAALRGMFTDLDDYSAYLEPTELADLQANTTGHFGGIGIELSLVKGFFTVIAPIDHTPAERGGIKAGDRIVSLDDQSVEDMQMSQMVRHLRGEPGTSVVLGIRRGSEEEVLKISLERAVIDIASVRGHLLEPGYAYVRISQFHTTTSDEFEELLENLADESGDPLQGLVLDLRNNPGGVLQSSVSVADALLEDGLIVYTEGRLPSSHARYRASGKDLMAGAPVVLLINEGSASASEIVAGALKDHARATLLGTRSYGKGSVQSVVPIAEGAIKLTTAYYYTPSGRNIHKKGINPDVDLVDGQDILDQALGILKSGVAPPETPTAEADTLHARL